MGFELSVIGEHLNHFFGNCARFRSYMTIAKLRELMCCLQKNVTGLY